MFTSIEGWSYLRSVHVVLLVFLHGSTWCADGKDGYEEPISLSSGNRERFLAMFKPDFPPSYRAAIFTITALGDGRALSIYIGVAWREVDIDRSPT